MPHAGAPLSFCLRVWKRSPPWQVCASCPFGAGLNRSLQSLCTRWYGSLSDYGRCVFGSGLRRFSHRVCFGRDYSP